MVKDIAAESITPQHAFRSRRETHSNESYRPKYELTAIGKPGKARTSGLYSELRLKTGPLLSSSPELLAAQHRSLGGKQNGFHLLKLVGIQNVVFAGWKEGGDLGLETLNPFLCQRVTGEAFR